jgi:FAD/FMN-containing dehydrogenase
MSEFIKSARDIVGEASVLTSKQALEPFITDWRGRFKGEAIAVIFPKNTKEVSEIVKLCVKHNIAITPQGGNTGLCGAATPLANQPQIVLRLDKMNKVRWVSKLHDSIAVDSGLILKQLQMAAETLDRLFPLSLGAEGSCQVGGNLSTNAGGTAVLRFGTMRDLTLGLEVVLPNGDILNLMTALRKDSTHIDLKHLFIGAEGTHGIITGAVLKLFPRPKQKSIALLKLEDFKAVTTLLLALRESFGDQLSAFEVMSRGQLEVIKETMPNVTFPFKIDSAWVALVELSDTRLLPDLAPLLEEMLFENEPLYSEALIAQNSSQGEAFWKIRHSVSEGSKNYGYVISHDSVVPLEAQEAFVEQISTSIKRLLPEAKLAIHGHAGDGNLHVLGIITHHLKLEKAKLEGYTAVLNEEVDRITHALNGSISAEHGIGYAHIKRFKRVTDSVEMTLLKNIKTLLDPHSLMNANKILGEKHE